MFRVWIDWGGGCSGTRCDEIQCYEFETLWELNAFLEGVAAASCAWGLDDFRQFNTEAEVEQYRRSIAN